MTGCFDDAVGDAEGTDDADDSTDTGENGGTSTGDATASQSRTWYSSGGVYQTYWDDGQYTAWYDADGQLVDTSNLSELEIDDLYNEEGYDRRTISSGGNRCLDWGPYYSSVSGEQLGERCLEWGYPDSESDWNLSDCTDNGGEIIWNYNVESEPYNYRYAPDCKMTFATINTTVGEALLIYDWYGFYISSSCDGVGVVTSSSTLTGKDYVIAPGTALECSHEIYRNLDYTPTEDRFDDQSIWSIVYAIQDTTVV